MNTINAVSNSQSSFLINIKEQLDKISLEKKILIAVSVALGYVATNFLLVSLGLSIPVSIVITLVIGAVILLVINRLLRRPEPDPIDTTDKNKDTKSSMTNQINGNNQNTVQNDANINVHEVELNRGCDISAEVISKIQASLNRIINRDLGNGIKFYKSQPNHRVFELDEVPGYIFKMKADNESFTLGHDDSMKARYQQMIKAQEVLTKHGLEHLVLPKGKLFRVNENGLEHEIIAEQKLDVNPESSIQEEYYEQYGTSLNAAVHDAAVYVCESGYDDVEWRNMPVLNNSFDAKGNRKFALIDIEQTGKVQQGLYGTNHVRGLIKCVNEEQGKIVLAVAKEKGYLSFLADDVLKERIAEIEDNRKIKGYHQSKGVVNGSEPVQINESVIDFSEYPLEHRDELKKTLREVVDVMNTKIAKRSNNVSMKERRLIFLSCNKQPFAELNLRILREDLDRYSFRNDDLYRKEASFLGCLVKKLAQLKIIFNFKETNGNGYFLQA